SIAAHALELQAKLLLCVELSNGDDSIFEIEYKKFKALGTLLSELGRLNLFNNSEAAFLKGVKDRRNEFTHQLSDSYINAIKGKISMRSLIDEFELLKSSLNDAEAIVRRILIDKATAGGVDVVQFNNSARNAVSEWENV